jgi:hypothetical protein
MHSSHTEHLRILQKYVEPIQFSFRCTPLNITLHEDHQRVFTSREKRQIHVYKNMYHIYISHRYLSEKNNSSAGTVQKNKTRTLYQKHFTAYDII